MFLRKILGLKQSDRKVVEALNAKARAEMRMSDATVKASNANKALTCAVRQLEEVLSR